MCRVDHVPSVRSEYDHGPERDEMRLNRFRLLVLLHQLLYSRCIYHHHRSFVYPAYYRSLVEYHKWLQIGNRRPHEAYATQGVLCHELGS